MAKSKGRANPGLVTELLLPKLGPSVKPPK